MMCLPTWKPRAEEQAEGLPGTGLPPTQEGKDLTLSSSLTWRLFSSKQKLPGGATQSCQLPRPWLWPPRAQCAVLDKV